MATSATIPPPTTSGEAVRNAAGRSVQVAYLSWVSDSAAGTVFNRMGGNDGCIPDGGVGGIHDRRNTAKEGDREKTGRPRQTTCRGKAVLPAKTSLQIEELWEIEDIVVGKTPRRGG